MGTARNRSVDISPDPRQGIFGEKVWKINYYLAQDRQDLYRFKLDTFPDWSNCDRVLAGPDDGFYPSPRLVDEGGRINLFSFDSRQPFLSQSFSQLMISTSDRLSQISDSGIQFKSFFCMQRQGNQFLLLDWILGKHKYKKNATRNSTGSSSLFLSALFCTRFTCAFFISCGLHASANDIRRNRGKSLGNCRGHTDAAFLTQEPGSVVSPARGLICFGRCHNGYHVKHALVGLDEATVEFVSNVLGD